MKDFDDEFCKNSGNMLFKYYAIKTTEFQKIFLNIF